MDSKEIYPSFASYELESDDEEIHGVRILSNPITPCTPIKPSTPGTPASTRSFSLSMDSGIGSPRDFPQPSGKPVLKVVNFQSGVASRNSKAKSSKAAEHTSKEKHRRERIKDSCNQLRVLLPYIRGRKTDMASILEMCVDYLYIVNAFMPQTLLDEIKEILSKNAADLNAYINKEGILNKSLMESKWTAFPPLVSTCSTTSMCTPPPPPPQKVCSSSSKSPNPLGAGAPPSPDSMSASGPAKRPRLMDTAALSESFTSPLQLENRSDIADQSEDGDLESASYASASATSAHSQGRLYPEMDDAAFGSMYHVSENYATAQQLFNMYVMNKSPVVDVGDVYCPSPALCGYYPNMVPCTTVSTPRLYYSTSDSVGSNSAQVSTQYGGMKLRQNPSKVKLDPYIALTPESTNDGMDSKDSSPK